LVLIECGLHSRPSSRLRSNYADGIKTESILYVIFYSLHSASKFVLFVSFQEDDWKTKVETILKFTRQLISILATQVDAPTLALRLFLLAAQVSDECGFEDLTYDLYVQAFTVYEDSISESRAQLQAITLVIGTLQGAKVFGVDNYDTLITKAALHGAKLLKKSHQATAVHLASHLWWQEAVAVEGESEGEGEVEKKDSEKVGLSDEGAEGARAVRLPILYG
jgi:vacuolar protein sorting-associated protein 35